MYLVVVNGDRADDFFEHLTAFDVFGGSEVACFRIGSHVLFAFDGIVIGKNGEMLKKIGTLARMDLEKNFGTKVNLKTWVKVKKDWVNDEKFFQSK